MQGRFLRSSLRIFVGTLLLLALCASVGISSSTPPADAMRSANLGKGRVDGAQAVRPRSRSRIVKRTHWPPGEEPVLSRRSSKK
jgi:hypothetical protein